MKTCNITFLPDKKTAEVQKGTTILEAAKSAALYITSMCGGDGVCGKCRVFVKKGKVETEPTGLLTAEEIDEGTVLACSTKVFEDIEVEIPPESRTEEGEVLLKGKLDIYSRVEAVESTVLDEAKLFTHSPLATKIFLKLPPPTLQDTASDLERIYRELRRKAPLPILQTGLANIKNLGRLLRESNWEITVTLGKRNGTTEIVLIESGDTSQHNYAVAVDIGTTTVVAHLIDLVSEKTIGAMGTFNKQISYGDDIITRIIFASEKEGLEKLHLAVTENINSLIASLVQAHSRKLEDITAVMVAGNTTMIHLLLGIDPTYIRKEPYIPTADAVPVIRAAEAGIRINPRGLIACAPNVSSYVGGDVTAGVLASGLADRDELAMYIDMGTNGEMVLGNKEWLTCCACSVGPAFEGSGIKSGTRAIKGAIQKLQINPKDYQAKVSTIPGRLGQARTSNTRAGGNEPPRGICGSGLVELLSEMLKTGLIDRAGKIPSDLKSPFIRKSDEGLEYVIVPATESATGRDITITQADLDNIIRSKAAVFAGTRTLVKKMGYSFQDVKKFYIAGAFGSHLDIEKSIAIGMLPDLPRERFAYIGNGSVTGASLILLSYEAIKKVSDLANKMTYIELSGDNTFHEEFISAMFLPHTDLGLFPSSLKTELLRNGKSPLIKGVGGLSPFDKGD